MSEIGEVRDGGSAFPSRRYIQHDKDGYHVPCEECAGMSLRDYFAAHAPESPPPWWQPVLTQRPYLYPGWHWCENCKAGVDPCNGDANCSELRRHFAEDADWSRELLRQTFLQWPWAYADFMLAARRGHPNQSLNLYFEAERLLLSLEKLVEFWPYPEFEDPDEASSWRPPEFVLEAARLISEIKKKGCLPK